MPYSKMQAVDEVPQRLAQAHRDPPLILVDPHDAVAQVVVPTEHVGVGVVHFVVRALPQHGRRGVVPLPRGGVDLGIAHPVPLTVHDVVADLHVLEDLGHREPRRAHQPRGREEGEQENGSAAELELALHVDDLADVGGVAGTPGAQDLLTQGVQLARQRLHLGGGQVGGRIRLAGGLRHVPALGGGHVEAGVRELGRTDCGCRVSSRAGGGRGVSAPGGHGVSAGRSHAVL